MRPAGFAGGEICEWDRFMKRFFFLLFLCLPLLLLSGCAEKEASRECFAMDTVMEVAAYCSKAEEAVQETKGRIKALENQLSRTKADSNVSRVNHNGTTPTTGLTYGTRALLPAALEYRDAPLSQCTQRLTSGPAAGLVTTPEHAAQYTAICRALTESGSDGPVFVTALAPWAYLCTDRPMGTSTSWRTYLDSELLEVYYRQHPERFPTTVLVLDEAVGPTRTPAGRTAF